MKFIKDVNRSEPLVDTVFGVVKMAQQAKVKLGDDQVVDATIGSLADEDCNLVAFKSVFSSFRDLKDTDYARYAEFIAGNPDYLKSLEEWIFDDYVRLPKRIIATPGGTGALGSLISNVLSDGEKILIPDIGWGSYQIMAKEHNLSPVMYSMFNGNKFDLMGLIDKTEKILSEQQKAVIIINSPCHNPTGYSLSYEEWKELFDYFSVIGEEIVLINDIAYIDYATSEDYKDYFTLFNSIDSNVLIGVAYSCSKSFTSYGLRLGALTLIHKDRRICDALFNACERTSRSYWSNVCNSAMMNVSYLLNNELDSYLAEKKIYIDLLQKRSDLFIAQAKEVRLPIYPYVEGFFVTLRLDNKTRDDLHRDLIEHHIYTIKVNKGIRIAICSVPLKKLDGLAKRISDILKGVQHGI